MTMTTVSTTYTKIAAALREQKLPDAPVDHQRQELFDQLAERDDPAMRENSIGLKTNNKRSMN